MFDARVTLSGVIPPRRAHRFLDVVAGTAMNTPENQQHFPGPLRARFSRAFSKGADVAASGERAYCRPDMREGPLSK
jgi:hypothetical protein